MSNPQKIAVLSDIPADGMRSFVVGERRIALFRAGETLYATDDLCSHDDARLTHGWFEPDDCTVECPLHGSRFDIRTGQALTLPAYRPIAVYPVRLDGEDVLVDLDPA